MCNARGQKREILRFLEHRGWLTDMLFGPLLSNMSVPLRLARETWITALITCLECCWPNLPILAYEVTTPDLHFGSHTASYLTSEPDHLKKYRGRPKQGLILYVSTSGNRYRMSPPAEDLSCSRIPEQRTVWAETLVRDDDHMKNDARRLDVDLRHKSMEMSNFNILQIKADKLRREARCKRDIVKTALQNF